MVRCQYKPCHLKTSMIIEIITPQIQNLTTVWNLLSNNFFYARFMEFSPNSENPSVPDWNTAYDELNGPNEPPITIVKHGILQQTLQPLFSTQLYSARDELHAKETITHFLKKYTSHIILFLQPEDQIPCELYQFFTVMEDNGCNLLKMAWKRFMLRFMSEKSFTIIEDLSDLISYFEKSRFAISGNR